MPAIKKNDEVLVISGESKGKKGLVIKVFPREAKVIVNGVNIRKKTRKTEQNKPKWWHCGKRNAHSDFQCYALGRRGSRPHKKS